MKTINKLGLTLAAAALTMAAQAVPITDLINGGTLTQGDKIFSDFTWSGPTGPAGISVSGIGDGSPGYEGLYGIRIDGIVQVGPGGGVWTLTYAVETALNSGMLIHDVYQTIGTAGPGLSSYSAVENVYDSPYPGASLLATSHVAISDSQDPPGELNDTLVLAFPRHKVWITKTITLEVPQQTGNAEKHLIVKQRFSQVPVPDGGTTVMLLGVVMAALGFAHRKLS